MTRTVGYVRAVPGMADTDDAVSALSAAGAAEIFIEAPTGARPEFDHCIEGLSPGDVLVVVSFAALATSLDGFVTTTAQLRARGIHLRSLSEPALSSSPNTDEVLAAVDALRRLFVGIRTREGMDAAAAAGRKLGRPRVMTAERTAVARELRAQSRSFAQIGRALGVSEAAVRRALRARAAEELPQSTAS